MYIIHVNIFFLYLFIHTHVKAPHPGSTAEISLECFLSNLTHFCCGHCLTHLLSCFFKILFSWLAVQGGMKKDYVCTLTSCVFVCVWHSLTLTSFFLTVQQSNPTHTQTCTSIHTSTHNLSVNQLSHHLHRITNSPRWGDVEVFEPQQVEQYKSS